MIFVTGDTHGVWERLNEFEFKAEPAEGDSVIVAGDFGFIFDGGEHDELILDALAKKSYTILFVDGNHENHPLLNTYPVEIWYGGKIHRIRHNVIHLMRGQVFELPISEWEHRKVFTFGGAFSVDRGFRRLGESYWNEEIPSVEELEEGKRNLEAHNNTVDYIVTHTMPTSVIKLNGYYIDDKMPDKPLTDFLDFVRENVSYTRWFAGHFHENKYANDSDRIKIMYQSIDYLD
ncbi:MAG: metallophosphoesterase [Clostridia bacterium]|nr:metallophosphoesterase [Clostridia bacterium]